MGTEILRPQDCLAGRIRTSPALFPRRKGCNYGNSYSNNGTNPNPSSNPRSIKKHHRSAVQPEKSDRRRRSGQPETSASKRWSSDDGRAGTIGLAVEKVTILRRGSSLDSKTKSELSLRREGANREAKQVSAPELGSPIMVKYDLYAGSAFALSPEPSSLPLPSFSKKKVASLDDSATRDLRRLLRLD